MMRKPNLVVDDAPEYRGCSPYERFRVNYELELARGMLTAAVSAVSQELARSNRATGTVSLAGSAINRYFKTDQTAQLKTLLSRLTAIQNRLSQGVKNWVCLTQDGCAANCGATAAACSDVGKPVMLCPRHFQSDDITGALTLIHETGHQIGLAQGFPGDLVTGGDIYQHDPQFGQLTTSQALNNPDSFAALVADLMYGPQFADLTTRAWSSSDMFITGLIAEPNLGSRQVGQLPLFGAQPPVLTRFTAGDAAADHFRARFVYNAFFDADSPHRPAILRRPEIALKIVLVRDKAGTRGKETTLLDKSETAQHNQSGIFETADGHGGYDVDLHFDAADQGAIVIRAEIRDPDTATTLTYRDALPIRPKATP